jgi:glycosyltransferase involved in cell wall biosynthesis
VKTTVVVCSASRPDVLSETIESLLAQSLRPHEIIVSVFNLAHVPAKIRADSAIRVVVSNRQALSAQRNAAVKEVRTPYTLFLDDDIEIAPNFIESMESLLDQVEDAVVATGFVVVDGVRGDTGVDRTSARAAVLNYVREHEDRDCKKGYGCNLFVRTRVFDQVLFDENLPLYGWLEDLDFSTNCLRYGRIISNAGTCVAHLGTPIGRISGLKFGYSQIVNPFYLWRKNGTPRLTNVVFAHWLVPVARNLFRTLMRIHGLRSDRTGRFKGNMTGFRHLLAGKVDPSYILQLQEAAERPLQVVGGNSAAAGRMT